MNPYTASTHSFDVFVDANVGCVADIRQQVCRK